MHKRKEVLCIIVTSTAAAFAGVHARGPMRLLDNAQLLFIWRDIDHSTSFVEYLHCICLCHTICKIMLTALVNATTSYLDHYQTPLIMYAQQSLQDPPSA